MRSAMTYTNDLAVFDRLESEVRSYCRSFETVFTRAKGAVMWDMKGKEYIDFFAGAGALNYGHNPAEMKNRLIEYLQQDGITHSLDMATQAKERFLVRFRETILEPRGMNYKVMFPGPTGTNAVESALKLARKATGRQTVIGFTNGFHGMTLGSLSITGNPFKRAGAGVPLTGSIMMPYDGFMGDELDTAAYLERMIETAGTGVDLPAAIVLETVQGEGGLNAAGAAWLRSIERICRNNGILLIVDDVQMGCGRTGSFFSFEQAGIRPDIVCLSKSIGGYGLPLALTLIQPEYDLFSPGEHNGTFRGNNLAFVAATEALDYWANPEFEKSVGRKGEMIRGELRRIAELLPPGEVAVRGRGMIQGLAFAQPALASRICKEAFDRGLIMETSGAADEVAKAMPPLTIDESLLKRGLKVLEESVKAVWSKAKTGGGSGSGAPSESVRKEAANQ